MLETSFIKKNIETQGKSPLRYINKKGIELYKCDHRKGQKDFIQIQNKKTVNKIQEERQIRLLERIYDSYNSSDEDNDSKLMKDLKLQYHNSLQELARAQNTIDSLRFGISKSQTDLNEISSKVSANYFNLLYISVFQSFFFINPL